MMTRKTLFVALVALLGSLLFAVAADAQGPQPRGSRAASATLGTGITYQGRLTDGGSAASGVYDFKFEVYDHQSPSMGFQKGGTVTLNDVTVTNGLFTASLDFGGGVFNGEARWLQIYVRPGASTSEYMTLVPRQQMTPAPYALALPGLYTQQNATSPNLIGGYNGNTVTASVVGATISGGGNSGEVNRVTDDYGTVGGGRNNRAGDDAGLTTDRPYATVAGGSGNTASAALATVAGGEGNTASNPRAFVGGGDSNTAGGYAATIGGGMSNTANGPGAFVGGGGYDGSSTSGNQASANASTIVGGLNNNVLAAGTYGTIGGGQTNTVNATHAAIAGGYFNVAGGNYASIGGGAGNRADAKGATVPGGISNSAFMSYTLAAGRHARAKHVGAFVWSDSDSNSVGGEFFDSTGDDQLLIRAAGGAGIVDAGTAFTPTAQLHVSSSGGDSTPQLQIDKRDATDYVRLRMTMGGSYSNRWDLGATANSFRIYTGKYGQNAVTIQPGDATNYMMMGNSARLTAGGAWTNASDRNAKEHFESVNGLDILARLATVPVQTWNYRAEDAKIRHIGPTAQDLYAAFRLGADDAHIATVDADGIAFAAIQGLSQIVQAQDRQIRELQAQNANLDSRLSNLEARLAAVEGGALAASAPVRLDPAAWVVVGLIGWAVFGRVKRGTQ